jgi:hypothetical protein
MTARAVREGYTDEGVVTLTLKPGGVEANPVPEKGAWSDVSDGAWYADAVDYVMGDGLFDEQGSGTFAPGAPMTRAMLVTALYRLAGEPAVTNFTDFSDITRGSPLSAAAGWAVGAGVSDGVGNGAFAPDNGITREQIATMFYRYTTGLGADTSAKGDLSAFTDSGKISAWATEALIWANGEKLINGMGDGTIAPQGTATRAQVAQILLNYAQ